LETPFYLCGKITGYRDVKNERQKIKEGSISGRKGKKERYKRKLFGGWAEKRMEFSPFLAINFGEQRKCFSDTQIINQ
jgi:hypothetical protein